MIAEGLNPRRMWLLVGVAAAVVLALSRAPVLWIAPRLWAEEADLFLAHAVFSGPFLALLENPALRAGYINLYPSLASVASLSFALERAPWVNLLFSAAVHAIALALVLFGQRDTLTGGIQRLVLVFIWFYFPYQSGFSEAWLNTINAQVFFGAATLLVLLGRARASPLWQRWSSYGVLAAGGLSGPYSIALLPLFVHSAWTGACRARWRQASILAACAGIQCLAFSYSLGSDLLTDAKFVERSLIERAIVGLHHQALFPLTGELLGRTLLQQHWLPSSGNEAMLGGASAMAAGAMLLFLIVVVAKNLRHGGQQGLAYALAAWLIWFALTIVTAVNGIAGFRYAVAPGISLGIALLLSIEGAKMRLLKVGQGALLAVGIATGIAESQLISPVATGLDGHRVDWPQQVALWREDPDARLQNWPHPRWYTHLPETNRLAALRQEIAENSANRRLVPGSIAELSVHPATGLPAVFELRTNICPVSGPDTPVEPIPITLELVGATARLAAIEAVVHGACSTLRINSMELSFGGFTEFSEVRAIRAINAAADPRLSVEISALKLGSPVLRAVHPVSGR